MPIYNLLVPIVTPPILPDFAVKAPATVTRKGASEKVASPSEIPVVFALKILSPEPILTLPLKVPPAADKLPLKVPPAADKLPLKVPPAADKLPLKVPSPSIVRVEPLKLNLSFKLN